MTAHTPGPLTVLAVVSTSDRTTVVAVHDRFDMSMSVICSARGCSPLGAFHTVRYSAGTTESERDWCRKDIEYTAALHAANHDTTPRPGHEGGQKS